MPAATNADRLMPHIAVGVNDPSLSGARPADWSVLGLDGDPVPGDPQVLQQIAEDFTYLRDTAWSVCQALDSFVASASAGGFEGETADTLRNAVSGRLKTFIYNIARSFSLAAEAVAEYKLALVPAQQAVAGLVSQAEAMTAMDPTGAGLKQQVQERRSAVVDAEQRMIQALHDAADMVSQPIKMPSLGERIWKGLEMALGITAAVLALLSTFVDGPLGIAAFAAGVAGVAMSGVDLARHRVNLAGFVMSLMGLLAPGMKGVFTLEQLGAGFRGFVGALGKATGDLGHVLSSPGALRTFVLSGGSRAFQALGRGPGLLVTGAHQAVAGLGRAVWALPHVLAATPEAVKSALGWAGGVVSRDFERVAARYWRLASVVEPHGAYVLVSAGRVLAALVTPMRFGEMAELGFRGAWAAVRGRASLTGAARALRAGWMGQAPAAGGELAAGVLHGLHGVRLGGTADAGAGRRGELLLAPVNVQAVRGLDLVQDVRHGLITVQSNELALLSAAGEDGRLDASGVMGLWVPDLAGHAGGETSLPDLEQLGAAALGADKPSALVAAVVPAAPPIVREKLAEDVATRLTHTKAGLLVPIRGELPPEGAVRLREWGPEDVNRLRAGHETLADPDRNAFRLDGTATLPHRDGDTPTRTDPVLAGPALHPVGPSTIRAAESLGENGMPGGPVSLAGLHGVRGDHPEGFDPGETLALLRARTGTHPEVRLPVSDVEPVVMAGRASEVRDGARPPLATVIPEQSIREVALPAPGRYGMRLQVIEAPTAAGDLESRPLQLVDASGAAVAGHQLLPRADGGLTITIPGGRQWHIGPDMRLQSARLPLTGEGIGPMSGLSLRLRYAEDGQVTERALTGDLGLMFLFEQVPVPHELVGRFGSGGISLKETATGEITHFNTAGQAVLRDPQSTTGPARQDLIDHQVTISLSSSTGGEIHPADPREALTLLNVHSRPDSTHQSRGLLDSSGHPVNDIHSQPERNPGPAGSGEPPRATQPAGQPGVEPPKSGVTPEKIAIALARVFAGNFVADSGSGMLYQALDGNKVTVRADLRTGAFDALGTAVFGVGGSTLAKAAGIKGALGAFLKGDGALGTTVNGSVGNVVGELVADGVNHQSSTGLWQDAITSAASGAVANVGSYALARADKERSRLNGKIISNGKKLVNAASQDLAGTVMMTASYTAGDVIETDIQNLASGG